MPDDHESRDVIDNEARVLDKLGPKSAGENVLAALQHGWLEDNRYYIDMELCVINLEQFIRRRRTLTMYPFWSFPPETARGPDICFNLWGITRQIASGLAFIHNEGEIHRDLKPQNGRVLDPERIMLILSVLLSIKDAVWKVADFGFTSEGLHDKPYTSVYGRGTPGYRAPELLDNDKKVASRATDIWAFGCIFYKLVTDTEAFGDDYKVMQFKQQQYTYPSPLTPPLTDPRGRRFINLFIDHIFQVDWSERPSAREIRDLSHVSPQCPTPVYVHHNTPLPAPVGLYSYDTRWKYVRRSQIRYHPI